MPTPKTLLGFFAPHAHKPKTQSPIAPAVWSVVCGARSRDLFSQDGEKKVKSQRVAEKNIPTETRDLPPKGGPCLRPVHEITQPKQYIHSIHHWV